MPKCPNVLAPCRRSELPPVWLWSLHDKELRLIPRNNRQTVLVFTPVMNPPGLALLRCLPLLPGLHRLRTVTHLLLDKRLSPRELPNLTLLVLAPFLRTFGRTIIHPLQQTIVLSPPAGTLRRQLTPPGREWKH